MKIKWKLFLVVICCCGVIAFLTEINTEKMDGEKEQKEISEEIIESKEEAETHVFIEENQNSSEEEFKNLCSEIVYNDISEQTVGKYVYKDLFNWQIKESDNRYLCNAIEDFIEDLKTYQKTYRNYGIIDCRYDSSFPIENSDIIRVYGIVDSVSQSYFTGGYNPTIKVYYIEYIRKYGEEPENKTMGEIRDERIARNEQIRQEIEYKNSLNTDYNGTTKNIDEMDELDLEDYLSHCDEMNYSNLTNGEDLTGRHVAIHVQLFKHKIFKSEKGKENRIVKWINIEFIQDDIWEIEFYSEQAEDYIPDFGVLYFQNIENISPMDMRSGENIIAYGQIINHPKESYDDWEVIVRYYEFE
ncbi:MAG: hypothetical protein K2O32_07090 [Acetatifactor sp.]|nr:hypothetical protein [Acetatifactor sp.]